MIGLYYYLLKKGHDYMGGNVYDNTSSIDSSEELKEICCEIHRILDIPLTYLENSLLGSANFERYPLNDLDINMDKDVFDIDIIHEMIRNRGALARIGNCIHWCLEVGENAYQIDLMFGDHKWQRFAYAGSHDPNYKGVHRVMLIKAYAALMSDDTVFENGELVARAGWTFLVQKGLMYRYRHKHFKKNSKNRVKAFSELILSDWNDFYREGQEPLTQPTTTITDPDKAMFLLFGLKSNDLAFGSYASLHDYLKRELEPQRYGELMQIYATMCEENRVLI